MNMWKTHPEVLYGAYKDEKGLTKEESDQLINRCIKECLTDGQTAEKWIMYVGYNKMDDIIMKRLPYPKDGSGDEENNYTNFLNDKIYFEFRKALENKTGIKL